MWTKILTRGLEWVTCYAVQYVALQTERDWKSLSKKERRLLLWIVLKVCLDPRGFLLWETLVVQFACLPVSFQFDDRMFGVKGWPYQGSQLFGFSKTVLLSGKLPLGDLITQHLNSLSKNYYEVMVLWTLKHYQKDVKIFPLGAF